MIVHAMISTMYGVVFGLITGSIHLTGRQAIIAGMVYGIIIVLFMSFIVLPIMGASIMPSVMVWPGGIPGHLMFGLALGAWVAWRSRDAVPAS